MRFPYSLISGLAATAILAVAFPGCGGDSTSPEVNKLLATSTIALRNSGSGQPSLPPTAEISFGVDTVPGSSSSDYPEPLLRMLIPMDGKHTKATYDLTADADGQTLAARLSDGDDGSMYLGLIFLQWGGIGRGSRESFLDFTAAAPREGPDLVGATVTALVAVVEEFTMSEPQPGDTAITCTVTLEIYGH